MSRCFPFPPPGYEKTPRPDGQLASHLLDKEKHKEKKHTKDRGRKEGKDKKDKERSKDKHRDKKDRKEKRKDKKDKSKDKSRGSEEGTVKSGDALHDKKSAESSRKLEESKDPKFREDLVRKTQYEKDAESRVSNERSRESISAAPALENERIAVHLDSINASRKNEFLGQQGININQQKNGTAIRHGENFNSSSQRTPDGFITAPTVEKDRVTGKSPLSNSTDSVPKKEGIGQRINNISILVQKKTESPNSANIMHKGNGKVVRTIDNAPISTQRFDIPSTSSSATGMDRGTPRSTIPSPSFTIRRSNGMVRPPESFSISTKKPGAGGLSPAMGKEKEPAGRMLQNNVSNDQKLVSSKKSVVEKVAVGTAERVKKVRDGAPDDAKKEDRKRDRHEKKKKKDKHKEKKKEKEAKKEKQEHNPKEDDKRRENSINYQVDSLQTKPLTPPLAPPVDDVKAILPDENLKKRKTHEMNGSLQNHHDMRPTKLPRPPPSSSQVENGTSFHVAAPLSSTKPDAINIEKAERLLKKEENINGNRDAQQPPVGSGVLKKEENINGNREAQRPSVGSALQDPVAPSGNGTPSRKSPHRDCKYLGVIYSVPEAPQIMECGHDEQDWLFSQGISKPDKPKSLTEANKEPQVWAQAVKIDSADVIALPYVIPF